MQLFELRGEDTVDYESLELKSFFVPEDICMSVKLFFQNNVHSIIYANKTSLPKWNFDIQPQLKFMLPKADCIPLSYNKIIIQRTKKIHLLLKLFLISDDSHNFNKITFMRLYAFSSFLKVSWILGNQRDQILNDCA